MGQKKIRVNFELKGAAAEAFIDLLTRQMKEEPSTSKADLGRSAFIEYANQRGFSLTDNTKWGGSRTEEGQIAAVSAA